MQTLLKGVLATTLVLAAVGCSHDKPSEYGRERPPLGDIDEDGRGLQSKDLLAATDQMAMSLLSLPELNVADQRWTIVAQAMENQTITARQNYDIFVDRLKTQLGKHGRGRVTLIENRDRYRDLQSRELEPGYTDEFGQGGGRVQPGGPGIQPEFVLYGKMQELPGRGTSTYRAEFNLTNFRTREQVWSDEYLVKVNR